MPPCPSGEPEPTIPGPGPQTAASQPSVLQAVVQRARGRDRLALAAERRARGQVSRRAVPLAQRAHRARMPPGSAPPSVCT